MQHVVGIDIAKYQFDLHLLPEDRTAHYRNNPQGITDCCRFLARLQPEAIVLEATGGYEQALTIELQAAGLPVIVALGMLIVMKTADENHGPHTRA